MAPECGEFDVADGLGTARAGFGELAGDATDLYHGDTREVGEDDRHLQDHPQSVADRVGRGVERLGAVTSLEQEGFATGDGGKAFGQVAGLAGEDQRRQIAHLLEDGLVGGFVGPLGLLERRAAAPGAGIPVGDRAHVHGRRRIGGERCVHR